MQRGRFVRELDQLPGARVRRGVVEQVDERDRGEHTRAATRACGHRRGVEPTRDAEQGDSLVTVEHDLGPVLVDEPEPGRHGVTVPPGGQNEIGARTEAGPGSPKAR